MPWEPRVPKCPSSVCVLQVLECPSALSAQVLFECPSSTLSVKNVCSITGNGLLHDCIELFKNFSEYILLFTSLNQLWNGRFIQKQTIWKVWHDVRQHRKNPRLSYDPRKLTVWKPRRVLFVYLCIKECFDLSFSTPKHISSRSLMPV